MSNLKKYKNIILITAVSAEVVCCTVILANVLAAGRKAQELPVLGQQAQGSVNGSVPGKGGFAQDSEGTARQSAEVRSESSAAEVQPDSPATAIQPESSSTGVQSDSLTTAIQQEGSSTGVQSDSSATDPQLLPAAAVDQNPDQQAVGALVEDFGKKLQMVSLLASKEIAAKTIKENYGDYVTPELLQKWMANPKSAPGRMGSSPWPDHIGILSTEPVDNDHYMVSGEIFEVTSAEFVKGGAAAKRPIELTVRKVDGRWLISGVTLGDYVKRGPVEYENKQYGFDFYLPEDWKGYSVVEAKWEGSSGGGVAATGPQLLIRNPAWTKKNPYQDIPIMIFTTGQWDALQNGKFNVSAAPIGPGKLGSNSKYVFALPPRYNYAFPTGYEEVEKIMNGSPLWPINPQ